MKIQSINSVVSWHNTQSNQKQQTYLKNSPINFRGIITEKQLQELPINKKLTNLFDICSTGDIIAIGKNFEAIKTGLAKSLSVLDEVIKRIFFIKHGELSTPLIFGMDSIDRWACVNIGNDSILLSHSDESVDTLNSCDTQELYDGDIINNKNVKIPIEFIPDFAFDDSIDEEDMELLTNPINYVNATFDLQSVQKSLVDSANVEILSILNDIPVLEEQEITETKSEETAEPKARKLSFKDVGGMDNVINSLKKSILFPIKFPYAYDNIKLNKGILLCGKPGTGKTLLAEALAGETNAEFMKISGTEYVSKWIGETEERWRTLFETAKEKQPSIIFIDEFDAIVKERGEETSQYEDRVVNQILSLMSDLEKSDDKVFVIATSNMPQSIDPAILRSGRFGKVINIPVPDKKGLRAIYDIHTKNKKVDPNLDTEKLIEEFFAREFTGADIQFVVNEAHTNSWVRNGIYEKMENETLQPEDIKETCITQEDFDTVLRDWDKSKSNKSIKPIGFKK